MRKVKFLFTCILTLSGCFTTPGIKEPYVVECVIVGDEADCYDYKTGESTTIPAINLTGYSCFSPKDTTAVMNHHEALHTDLNRCLKKQR